MLSTAFSFRQSLSTWATNWALLTVAGAPAGRPRGGGSAARVASASTGGEQSGTGQGKQARHELHERARARGRGGGARASRAIGVFGRLSCGGGSGPLPQYAIP